KAAYRFWDSEKVTPEAIIQAHAESTARRANMARTVLNVQDTSEFNLSGLRETSGLGYLSNKFCRGIIVHTGLAVTTDGVVLGVVFQKQWVRRPENLGKKHDNGRRNITEKESYRWIEEEQAVL